MNNRFIRRISSLKVVGEYDYTQLSNLLEELEEEDFMPILNALVDKPRKTKQDVAPLVKLLTSFPNLISLLKKSSDSVQHMLEYISTNMKPEVKLGRDFLFRFGQKGDKFFVVLKGKMNILIPIDLEISLSEDEFIFLLVKLKLLREQKIFELTLNSNKQHFLVKNSEIASLLEKIETKNFTNLTLPKRSLDFEFTEGVMALVEEIETNQGDQFWTVDEYISLVYPNKFKKNKFRKELKLFGYKHLTTQSEGQTFGEIALSDPNSERTASVMTEGRINVFGVLNKKLYEECLKENREKEKKANINMLLNSIIFGRISYTFFSKFIYTKLVHKKVYRGDCILKEGEVISNLQFLKKGDFQLKITASILDINKIIKDLGGCIPNEEEEVGRMVGKLLNRQSFIL